MRTGSAATLGDLVSVQRDAARLYTIWGRQNRTRPRKAGGEQIPGWLGPYQAIIVVQELVGIAEDLVCRGEATDASLLSNTPFPPQLPGSPFPEGAATFKEVVTATLDRYFARE